jgi:hypothetical protein
MNSQRKKPDNGTVSISFRFPDYFAKDIRKIKKHLAKQNGGKVTLSDVIERAIIHLNRRGGRC